MKNCLDLKDSWLIIHLLRTQFPSCGAVQKQKNFQEVGGAYWKDGIGHGAGVGEGMF